MSGFRLESPFFCVFFMEEKEQYEGVVASYVVFPPQALQAHVSTVSKLRREGSWSLVLVSLSEVILSL